MIPKKTTTKAVTAFKAGDEGWASYVVTDADGNVVTNVIEIDTVAGTLTRHASGPDGQTLTRNGEIVLETLNGAFTIK